MLYDWVHNDHIEWSSKYMLYDWVHNDHIEWSSKYTLYDWVHNDHIECYVVTADCTIFAGRMLL